MSWFDDWRQARDAYRTNPVLFFGGIIGAFAYAGIGIWLMITATWPDGCDHSGRKLIGMFNKLYCSPDLLGGGAAEWGLFLWLWSLPIGVATFIIWALVKKRSKA
jgi:hypothetical protein